jgi:RNA polymerase sigma factor (sigma-70 family)
MASSASSAVAASLRQLKSLFGAGTAVGLSDGQLLARYAFSRDEAAFEALVARHGPMVLATCRAVLHHEHDVEDAFQATFVVLAQKARSVRAGDALGGWLHRVAYRIAVQANAQKRRRRRKLEAAMADLSRPEHKLDPEIATIVHDEVDRLPDCERLPVVLCDLEGLTYEEAAGRLHWTEPTLRHRLVKARGRLRVRLTRHGITAGAIIAILADSAAGASAAVPIALAHSAVVAATRGAVSTVVSGLAAGMIRSLVLTKLKFASAVFAALVIVATATASARLVAVATGRDDARGPAKPAPAKVTVTVIGLPSQDQVAIPQPDDRPVEPIEGRIVDAHGHPVPGVRIEITELWNAPNHDLGRWLEQARDRGVAHPTDGLLVAIPPGGSHKPALPQDPNAPRNTHDTTTGPDGRFQLVGVGSNQIARIRISGSTTATTQIYVFGRFWAEVRATSRQWLKPSQVVYHPRRFEFAVAPCTPIQGVARDQDTGRPIPGIKLHGAVYDEHSLIPAEDVEATSDDEGRYCLNGLPVAPAYRVFVEAGAHKPYPNATLKAIAGEPSGWPTRFDISLKRGIWVRGTVTDKATGQPVNAVVDAFAFENNPYLRDFPGFRSSQLGRASVINGRYEVVALPGRGIIAVQSGGFLDRYRRAVGAAAIKGYGKDYDTFQTVPHYCIGGSYHILAEINLDPKAESVELNLQIDPGHAITVTAVDSDGRPVSGTVATGVCSITSTEYSQEAATIDVVGLDPSSPRRLTIVHRERKLIGSVYLKGDETQPLTVRLVPYGTITGRVLGHDRRPLEGLGILSAGGSHPKRLEEQAVLAGGASGSGIPVDRDGRFRVEGLIPGLKYSADAGAGMNLLGPLFRDLILAPGETRDLGDIKLAPPGVQFVPPEKFRGRNPPRPKLRGAPPPADLTLHIGNAQQLGRRFIELIRAAQFLEFLEQVMRA